MYDIENEHMQFSSRFGFKVEEKTCFIAQNIAILLNKSRVLCLVDTVIYVILNKKEYFYASTDRNK